MSYKNTILEKIVDAKKEELGSSKFRESLADLKAKAGGLEPTRDFLKAFKCSTLSPSPQPSPLKGEGEGGEDELPPTRIIAEIKKASPSAGVIRAEFDPAAIAKIYIEAGAAAISVLTDAPFFQGSLNDLQAVRKISVLPLLRKDFMIDPYQVYQARVYGADCILAIAAILEKQQRVDLCGLAEELGLASLIEVHDERELAEVLPVKQGKILLGINNRDLKTLKIDLKTTEKLRPLVPPDLPVIAESGFSKRQEIERLLKAGVNGFLIGETFLKAKDMKTKFNELIGK